MVNTNLCVHHGGVELLILHLYNFLPVSCTLIKLFTETTMLRCLFIYKFVQNSVVCQHALLGVKKGAIQEMLVGHLAQNHCREDNATFHHRDLVSPEFICKPPTPISQTVTIFEYRVCKQVTELK